MSDDWIPSEVDPAEVAGLIEEGQEVIVVGFPTADDEVKRLIDPVRVEAILLDCLFRKDELHGETPPPNAVQADGPVTQFHFHRERLNSHREEVRAILRLLSIEFVSTAQGGGGGWSFLQGCVDKNGTLWTGLQRRVEQLLALGMALGYVTCQIPREYWAVLPGGVPYYEIML